MDREARIRARAYDIWEAEGSPSGLHEEHWTRASSEIEQEDAGTAAAQAPASADEAPAKPKRVAKPKAEPAKPKAGVKSATAKTGAGEAAAAKPAPRTPRGKGKTRA